MIYELSEQRIKNKLNTNFIARNICIFDKIASTNTAAKQNCDMNDGTLFAAESQTKGRGRTGREWSSPHGEDVFMSVLLKPKRLSENTPQLTLAAGVAVCRALADVCAVDARIKWPNDIVIGTKKVCGILTELAFDKNGDCYVVVGIGINVNRCAFDGELRDKATSLAESTGVGYDRNEIISAVINEFEKYYLLWQQGGFEMFREEYKRLCVNIGRAVVIIKDNQSQNAICRDISENGELIADIDGRPVTVRSGEVSVRGLYGYV